MSRRKPAAAARPCDSPPHAEPRAADRSGLDFERAQAAPAGRLRGVAAVVLREGRLLLTQRPAGGPHGLLWEFPGGKVEAGESVAAALRREILEELGVGARPLEILGREAHDYPDGPAVEIVFVRCELDAFDFAPSHAVHAVRWVPPVEVDLAGVLAADRAFLRRLGAPA